LLTEHPLDWVDESNCAGADSDVFFRDDTTRAMELCLSCPVRESHCLSYTRAVETLYGPQEGVWAGLTKQDRRHLKAVD
jgi:hypothetical protein